MNSIRIVLVETSHPGNIGATARAMKTMGLSRLYLVNPKLFPDQKAYEMAAGADDVLEKAVVTQTLDEAIDDCQLILATSARPRDIDLPGLTPYEQAALIHQQSGSSQVAILFGREHAGLTNQELLKAQYHIMIPSNPDYSSLNLAQAVQIIAYELRMKAFSLTNKPKKQTKRLATAYEVEGFHQHLEEVLIQIDFLKPSNPKRLLQRLRRLFSRIQLEHLEVNLLRGFLSNLQRALRKQE